MHQLHTTTRKHTDSLSTSAASIQIPLQHAENSRLAAATALLQLPQGATLWSAQHLPQNRDVFMVGAGDGSLSLYKYCYPDRRCVSLLGGTECEG